MKANVSRQNGKNHWWSKALYLVVGALAGAVVGVKVNRSQAGIAFAAADGAVIGLAWFALRAWILRRREKRRKAARALAKAEKMAIEYPTLGGAASTSEPMDLPGLRFWICQLVADYEQIVLGKRVGLTIRQRWDYHKALNSIKQASVGYQSGPSKDKIRELVAAGVASYASRPADLPRERVPEQLIVDLATYALWPLVIVPKLPESYFQDLTEIYSESLALLVARARMSRTTKSAMTPQEFGRALSELQFAPGMMNLLNDLADPKRGGSAFTALALARTGSVPPKKAHSKDAVLWVLSAAVGGIIGNRADEGLSKALDWLTEASGKARGSIDPSDHGPPDASLSDHHPHHASHAHEIAHVFHMLRDIFN